MFVTTRGIKWQPQSRNRQNHIPHTSKMGRVLPVCLRNNRCRANQSTTFPCRRQSNLANIGKIVHVIVLELKKSIPKPKFAPLKKSKWYFRFHLPPSRKSKLINLSVFRIFATIRGKRGNRHCETPKSESAHLKNWISTSGLSQKQIKQ